MKKLGRQDSYTWYKIYSEMRRQKKKEAAKNQNKENTDLQAIEWK